MESIHGRAARLRHPGSYAVAAFSGSWLGTVTMLVFVGVAVAMFVPHLFLLIPLVWVSVWGLRKWSDRRDRRLGTVWPAQVRAQQDANRAAWGQENRRAAGWDRPQPEYYEPPST